MRFCSSAVLCLLASFLLTGCPPSEESKDAGAVDSGPTGVSYSFKVAQWTYDASGAVQTTPAANATIAFEAPDGRVLETTSDSQGNATISGDTVVVSAASVAAPAKVRYAWADNPVFNLYNTEGLPASPFSTESREIAVGVLEQPLRQPRQPASLHTVGGAASGWFDARGRRFEGGAPCARQIAVSKRKGAVRLQEAARGRQ